MAIGVLRMIDASTTNDNVIGVILLRTIPLYGNDVMTLAVEAECMRFVALNSVQKLITIIWTGSTVPKTGFAYKLKVSKRRINHHSSDHQKKNIFKYFLSCLSFGLLAPFLLFEKKARVLQAVSSSDHFKWVFVIKIWFYFRGKP